MCFAESRECLKDYFGLKILDLLLSPPILRTLSNLKKTLRFFKKVTVHYCAKKMKCTRFKTYKVMMQK